ncbi:MAG: hypothetical protein IPN62_18830 [Flavobacteriales bacterium]|nr:hypothetical protein [Flavobacteriales bacterium]
MAHAVEPGGVVHHPQTQAGILFVAFAGEEAGLVGSEWCCPWTAPSTCPRSEDDGEPGHPGHEVMMAHVMVGERTPHSSSVMIGWWP